MDSKTNSFVRMSYKFKISENNEKYTKFPNNEPLNPLKQATCIYIYIYIIIDFLKQSEVEERELS